MSAGGLLFWAVVAIGALAVVALVLLLSGGRRPPAPPEEEAAGRDDRRDVVARREAVGAATEDGEPGAPPAPRWVQDGRPAAGWDLAVLTFERTMGAERAHATVRREVRGDPRWLRDVAFAEVHRHGRVLLRGTFGGRYVDVWDLAALPGQAAIVEVIRAGVPVGGSALVAFAPLDQVSTLVGAFHGRATRIRRHPVSAAQAAALAKTVDRAPRATAPRHAAS